LFPQARQVLDYYHCAQYVQILLANLLQSSRSTFSRGS
jgi:hypothetical protein